MEFIVLFYFIDKNMKFKVFKGFVVGFLVRWWQILNLNIVMKYFIRNSIRI